MGFFGDIADTLGGVSSDQDYSKLPGVSGPNAGAYQIGGLGDYQNAMQGLSKQYGTIGSGYAGAMQSATAAPYAQQQALQAYQQNIAMGNGQTAADQMLGNAQAQGASQLQSGMVGIQGQNASLSRRQLMNAQAAQGAKLAGMGAQQKLQEQQQYSGMAQQGAQAMYAQQANQVQSNYLAQMATAQAQQNTAQGVFNSNSLQTNYNTQLDQRMQSYQLWMRQQAQQQQQAHADAQASMWHSVLSFASNGLGQGSGEMLKHYLGSKSGGDSGAGSSSGGGGSPSLPTGSAGSAGYDMSALATPMVGA